MTEERHKVSEAKKRRGIYLLPNLFTTAGLFAGFYAIVAAMVGHFSIAAIAIYVAMITDGLDGRVARLTNTQSAFGGEFDSLADMVSFGVAPALVAYSWGLSQLGKIGWLAAFIYVAAGALRLARFNTHLDDEETDKRYFQGLPIPAGAGIMAGLIWACGEMGVDGHAIALLVALVTVCVGCLMVSNVRYHSFKQIDLKGKISFVVLLLIVVFLVFISVDPPKILFILFAGYGLSGPVLAFRGRKKQQAIKQKESDDD